MSGVFKFKQFSVANGSCGVKVGTDGVLLGAWADLSLECKNILDIGTGTGIVALVASQRLLSAQIDAVEIDEQTAEVARSNFEGSPWSDRLTLYLSSFQDFVFRRGIQYDCILSNPPYFIDSLKNSDSVKSVARHAESLPQQELAAGVAQLLTSDGVFSAIFPYREGNLFVAVAALEGLYCTRRCEVIPVEGKPVKRLLLQFSKKRKTLLEERLVIENSPSGGNYTDEYKLLTGNFYLRF